VSPHFFTLRIPVADVGNHIHENGAHAALFCAELNHASASGGPHKGSSTSALGSGFAGCHQSSTRCLRNTPPMALKS
jgi:hypothetical protein